MLFACKKETVLQVMIKTQAMKIRLWSIITGSHIFGIRSRVTSSIRSPKASYISFSYCGI
jgi:hypothetical protein